MPDRDTVIAMAKKCGFAKPSLAIGIDGKARTVLHFRADKLVEFAALVAAQEREQCALIADEMDFSPNGAIGSAIRARKEET